MRKSRLGWFTGPVIALCLALMTGLVPGLAQPAQAAPGLAPLGWKSGVSVNFGIEAVDWDVNFRHRPVDVVNVFTTRDRGWDPLVEPGYIRDNLGGFQGLLVVSAPFWPVNYKDKTNLQHMKDCAAGRYSAQWQRFGRWAGGMPNQVVARIGWEGNGNWYEWSAGATPQQWDAWTGCFRKISEAIDTGAKPSGEHILIDWSINRGVSSNHSPQDAYRIYPGDPWVDVVSMNSYDQWPTSYTEDDWNRQFNAPGGLGDLIRFAAAHRKLWGVPEWSVSKNDKARPEQRDSADHIIRMWRMFSYLKPFYETYFNDPDPGNVYSALHRPNLNPNAAGAYNFLW